MTLCLVCTGFEYTISICAGSKTGAQGPSDQLLLWAVEGLAGVVINGVPNNVPGTRALNTPRAVLWGQHDDLLTWPGRIWNTADTKCFGDFTAADFQLGHGSTMLWNDFHCTDRLWSEAALGFCAKPTQHDSLNQSMWLLMLGALSNISICIETLGQCVFCKAHI
jgi:hypothetical protein